MNKRYPNSAPWAYKLVSTIKSPHIACVSFHVIFISSLPSPGLCGIDWQAIDGWIPPKLERFEVVVLEVISGARCSARPNEVMLIEDTVMRAMPKAVGRGVLIVKSARVGW